MKKVLLGMACIMFGMSNIWLHDYFGNDIFILFSLVFPFIGIGISIWGTFEKEESSKRSN